MGQLIQTRLPLTRREARPLPNLLEVPHQAFEWFCFKGIREVFDDHKALTNALRAGSADETSAAITVHANRVRTALAAFLAESTKAAEPVQSQQVA